MNMPLLRNQAALQKSVERLNRWQSTSFIDNPSYAVFTYASDPQQTLVANVTLILKWDYVYYNSDFDSNTQTPFFLYPPPTTQIYIPQEGMYNISLSGFLTVAATKVGVLYVNGVNCQLMNDAIVNRPFNFAFQRYFDEADIVEIGLFLTVASAVESNSLNELNESPLLSIKKL